MTHSYRSGPQPLDHLLPPSIVMIRLYLKQEPPDPKTGVSPPRKSITVPAKPSLPFPVTNLDWESRKRWEKAHEEENPPDAIRTGTGPSSTWDNVLSKFILSLVLAGFCTLALGAIWGVGSKSFLYLFPTFVVLAFKPLRWLAIVLILLFVGLAVFK